MTQPGRRLWNRRRIVLAALVLMLAGTCTWGIRAYRRYTGPENVRAIAQQLLSLYTGATVEIGGASFELFGRITLHDVRMVYGEASPAHEVPHVSTPFFACPRILIAHDPGALLRGNMRILSVVAETPRCEIVRDRRTGASNVRGILSALGTPGILESQGHLPTFELREARIAVVEKSDAGRRRVDELHVTVRGRPSSHDAHLYDIAWQEHDAGRSGGHTRLNMRTGTFRNVEGGLPAMAIEAVMLALDAGWDGAGGFGDLLGLGGTVRVEQFVLGGPPEQRRYATIRLADAALSIPIDEVELTLSPQERYLRFDRVHGEITVTTEHLEADFRGMFHRSPCRVRGRITGGIGRIQTLDDVAVEAHLEMRSLELPQPAPQGPDAQERFIRRWHALSHFYDDFRPGGTVDLSLEITKAAGPDAPVLLQQAELTALNVNLMCDFFPYHFSQVTGRCLYTPQGVFLDRLLGFHAGGIVTLSGWFEAFRLDARADLVVSGYQVPLDQDLYHALPEETQEIWDAFRLSGTINVDMLMHRPRGQPRVAAPWQRLIRIDPIDATATYARFPYPVHGLQGTVLYDRDRIEVITLTADHEGELFEATGAVDCLADGTHRMALTIDVADIPLDTRLIEAIPPAHRRRVQSLRPEGRLNARTQLTSDGGAAPLDFVTQLTLSEGRLHIPETNLILDEVHAALRLDPLQLDATQLGGRLRGASVRMQGACALDPDVAPLREVSEAPALSRMDISLTGLECDDELLRSLPAFAAKALGEWRLTGPLDARVQLVETAGPERQWHSSIDAELRSVTVRHPRIPQPIEYLSGHVAAKPGQLVLEALSGTYAGAPLRVTADLAVESGTHPVGTASLHVERLKAHHALGLFSGESDSRLWKDMRATGEISIHLPRIEIGSSSPSKSDNSTYQIEGQLLLHDLALPGIAGSPRASGRVNLNGYLRDRHQGCRLDGNAVLPNLTLFSRELTDLEADWSLVHSHSGDWRLKFSDLCGALYEGLAHADISLMRSGSSTRYDIRATALDVDLPALLRPNREGGTESETTMLDIQGRTDFTIHLDGDAEVAASRRGWGGVAVKDARLNRVPLLLAILNVMNLKLPDEHVFTESGFDYYIQGERMDLERITLRSDALWLTGTGTISLRENYLDAYLFSINPREWARIPLISDILDGTTRELVTVRVFGRLAEPVVKAESFPRVAAALRNLFRARESERSGSRGSR